MPICRLQVKLAPDPGLWSMNKKKREAAQKEVLEVAIAAVTSGAAKDARLPGYRGGAAVASCNPPGDE